MTPSQVSDCLSEDDAVAYVRAVLDENARARVEAHIDRCAECRWLISELARGARTHTGPFDSTGIGSLLEEHDTLRPGQQVGRYVIGERLGSGAMGVVHAAYDPELDRKVALKVVGPGAAGDVQLRARLLAEARAMARLSHPGVVPIYDVSTLGEDVVLAMEMVDGQDARRWLDQVRPSWQEAVAVLSQAGRGLAAAHAAGIVHRDVKPSNVLIGRDGAARITDFGLARATPRDGDATDLDGASPEGSGPVRSLGLTRPGALVGTPAYMAPEQHKGGPADALSDQFSFCLVLYEGVYGERAFQAPQGAPLPPLDALAAEVTAGRVRPPPKESRVPPWLRRILLRGLSVEPAARWPSVAAMLDALEDTPRRRRRKWVVAGGAATVVALVAGFVAFRAPGADEVCTGAAADLDRAWPRADQTAALARIAEKGPYGRILAPLLQQQLGEHAARWVSGHREACLAHRRGAQSSELLDRRMACLERSRVALAAVADVIRLADERGLPETVLAVRSLPDPSACGDIVAVLASVPPPPPELAERAATIGATLERARVFQGAGRIAEAREQSAKAVAGARSLGYPPLLARALLAEGRAAMDFDDRAAAGPALAEATKIAVEVGDDALAVEAWARGAWATGTSGGDPAAALAGLDIVEALAARNRSASFARALLHNNVGVVVLARGRRDEARALFERALAEARGVTGPGAVELVNVRGNVAMVTDDPKRRDALVAEAESELTRLLGADHPQTLFQRFRRGMLIPELAAARELLSSACEAYERFHHEAAAASAIECWGELGYVSEELGDRAGALAAAKHAAGLPGGDQRIAAEAGGYLALWQGDARGASKLFAGAMAEVTRRSNEPWWITFDRATLAVGLGRALRSAGDPRGARAALEQAVLDLVEAQRAQPAAVIDRRLARGRAELVKALIATGGDVARIAENARAASALLRSEGGRADEIAELERVARGP